MLASAVHSDFRILSFMVRKLLFMTPVEVLGEGLRFRNYAKRSTDIAEMLVQYLQSE